MKNRYVLIPGLILTAIAIVFILNKNSESSFEDETRMPTYLMNKKKMRMIDDSVTRFDSAVVLPNKVFQYNLTLVKDDTSSVNVDGLKKDAYAVLLHRLKTISDFQLLRKHKATVIYHYKDKKGQTLFKLIFPPETYIN